MRRRFCALVALLAFATTSAPLLAAAPPPLAETDLRALVTLLDPRIAPDGAHVALVLRRPDFVKDTYANELVLVDTRTGVTRSLSTREDVANARWSPSGDQLGFIATPAKDPAAKVEPSPQLFVLSMRGGDAHQVTNAKKGVSSFAWRGDGRTFAYIARDVAPDDARITAKDDWFVVDDDAWTSRAAAVAQHLWTIGADGAHARRVTSGTWSLTGDPVYGPDGNTVYAVRTPSASTNHYRRRTLVAIDTSRGTVRTLPTPADADNPAVSPDGTLLLYGAENPQAFSQSDLYVTSLAGHGRRDLTARLDRNVQFAAFGPGGVVFTGANDGAHDRLYAISHDGRPAIPPLGDVELSGGATASRDGTLAFVGVTPVRPPELYVLASTARAPRRLTAYNASVAAHAFGRTRTIEWTSADGLHLDGTLTEPPGTRSGTTSPLIVLIHGGPTATSTVGFSPLAQLMAARGWLVFQPNYRGSDNLGHRFAQATVPAITSAPGHDVLDGVDAVEKLGMVDRTRIGVCGWSEGGLLTSWLIGHDHRWKAAYSGAAVNDWLGYADMTDAQDFAPSFIGDSPWTNAPLRARYAAESPLTYAAQVTTPTLIVTDAGDFRVPTPLSYEFFHAIRATGTPVQMVVIPVNGHNPSDPLHREERTHGWIDWFATHL